MCQHFPELKTKFSKVFQVIAIATCIRTNQNPNSVRRREAPPHTIWVLCPNKIGLAIRNGLAIS
jgi:hypothetical protein